MEILNVMNVSKHFGGVQVLQDISFSVSDGEKLAIIGPNGAGKTTLLNLVSGQLLPTRGRICFLGKDITNMPPYHRAHLGLGRSFQLSSLFSNLTILENMLLAVQGTQTCRFKLFRSIDSYGHLYAKAQELLIAMELWEKREEPVQILSFGEQRKLEIALSLASKPKLLLLDEPSAGLTVDENANIANIIQKQVGEISVILVDHDIDLVFNIADRVIVLHRGQIIAEGRPEKIQNDTKVREIYMGTEGNTKNVGSC